MKKTILCVTAITTSLLLSACGNDTEISPSSDNTQGQEVSMQTDDTVKKLKSSESDSDKIVTSLDDDSTLTKNSNNTDDKAVVTADDKNTEKNTTSKDDTKAEKADPVKKADAKSEKKDEKAKKEVKKSETKKADAKKKDTKSDDNKGKNEKNDKKTVYLSNNEVDSDTVSEEDVINTPTESFVTIPRNIETTNKLTANIKPGMTLDNYNKVATKLGTTIDDTMSVNQDKLLILIKATNGAVVGVLNNKTNKFDTVKGFNNSKDAKKYMKSYHKKAINSLKEKLKG